MPQPRKKKAKRSAGPIKGTRSLYCTKDLADALLAYASVTDSISIQSTNADGTSKFTFTLEKKLQLRDEERVRQEERAKVEAEAEAEKVARQSKYHISDISRLTPDLARRSETPSSPLLRQRSTLDQPPSTNVEAAQVSLDSPSNDLLSGEDLEDIQRYMIVNDLLPVEELEDIRRNMAFIARGPAVIFDGQYVRGYMNEEFKGLQELVDAGLVSAFWNHPLFLTSISLFTRQLSKKLT